MLFYLFICRSMVDLDSKASVTINGAQHEVNSANMVKIRQIGQGAHGTVDLMKHMETGTFMAVKVIICTFWKTLK